MRYLLVRLVESSDARACSDLPHLELAPLTACCEVLRVSAECAAQHCLLVHHQFVLHLEVKVLAQLARVAVPQLDEPVHAACHQALPIGREQSRFGMGLAAKPDKTSRLPRYLFLHFLLQSAPTTAEEIEGIPFGEHTLGQLEPESLSEQRQQSRGRNHRHFHRQAVSYLLPPEIRGTEGKGVIKTILLMKVPAHP